jgi:hypothetical protein
MFSSGMPPYAADGLASFGYDRQYIIHNIRNIKPSGSFRSDFAYQNNLWLVAAELVEKLCGSDDNMKNKLIQRLAEVIIITICLGYYVYMISVIFHNSITGVTLGEISSLDDNGDKTKAPALIVHYIDNTKLDIDLWIFSSINLTIIITLWIIIKNKFVKKIE